uniref:Uncharacterized protein n=1 Tax=Romanomermis culicivorax TaxID=13658 RepID=A0A915KZK6_ROMCU
MARIPIFDDSGSGSKKCSKDSFSSILECKNPKIFRTYALEQEIKKSFIEITKLKEKQNQELECKTK